MQVRGRRFIGRYTSPKDECADVSIRLLFSQEEANLGGYRPFKTILNLMV